MITTKDALLLVQKCLEGELTPIPRRPHDRERPELVRPGNVFIYNENDSGIKRWTDGVNWSPSRILGNFLVYRELDQAFPPGEKKKATKRAAKRFAPYERNSNGHSAANGEVVVKGASRHLSKEEERVLVGSLNESYQFKADGLIKRTVSLTNQGQIYHVVWYISFLAFIENRLLRPEEVWAGVTIKRSMLQEQNFRCPLNPDASESTPASRQQQGRIRSPVVHMSQGFGQMSNLNSPLALLPHTPYIQHQMSGGQYPSTAAYVHRADGQFYGAEAHPRYAAQPQYPPIEYQQQIQAAEQSGMGEHAQRWVGFESYRMTAMSQENYGQRRTAPGHRAVYVSSPVDNSFGNEC